MAKVTTEQKARNMAGFIRGQSLLLLALLEELALDDLAADCDKLHELAEKIEQGIPAGDG